MVKPIGVGHKPVIPIPCLLNHPSGVDKGHEKLYNNTIILKNGFCHKRENYGTYENFWQQNKRDLLLRYA